MNYMHSEHTMNTDQKAKQGHQLYSEPLMIVKIDISRADGYGIEDVIYYRYKLPMNLTLRYKWYFEYLAALVKVHNPRRRVKLYIGRQNDETLGKIMLCGKDYIDSRIPTLIAGKKRAISRIRNKNTEADLFNLRQAEREDNIAQLQAEIDALERGEFNHYIFPTYINKIKKWTQKHHNPITRAIRLE